MTSKASSLTAVALSALGLLAGSAAWALESRKEVAPVLAFTMKSLAGQEIDLRRYQGNVVLIVNTASNCRFTPQYNSLEALNRKYHDRGLRILGFPANDFHGQEPGTNAEINAFCRKNYGITFDMFSKISVLGADKAPLYKFLTEPATNPRFSGMIRWNFEKFLVNRNGEIVARFAPPVDPRAQEVVDALEAALGLQ
ncbi:MAG TPA: glutathione peroxidase [Thermoanaerobaculia bacterium]|nr:glutathione peroxidase [Thermoanaerobaculia bacterium]